MFIIIVLFLSQNDSNFVNLPLITKSTDYDRVKGRDESSVL
jgi:hypothetical protein